MEEPVVRLGELSMAPGAATLLCEGGSILAFSGDAIVNAANAGGVAGFGVDQAINRAAGDFEIKQARQQFNGIETGCAKTTSSFKHTRVRWIIHAVGPVYRERMFSAPLTEADMAAKVGGSSIYVLFVDFGVCSGDPRVGLHRACWLRVQLDGYFSFVHFLRRSFFFCEANCAVDRASGSPLTSILSFARNQQTARSLEIHSGFTTQEGLRRVDARGVRAPGDHARILFAVGWGLPGRALSG